ncbi:hypothetical protein TNIN_477401 [Trichonephila inaurata madagascariensis]|uniref:Uncharacterized protein n=1 Tax=Trichonephila inaurata madagascariensis TaxID=2747483 RepID=A0A8X6XUA7_9ARAC|nr:hypothetical protein TNIN_477401 [Trichonephila inaurata madagascariensis]
MEGYLPIGNIILFLEEAVSFFLQYNNLNCESPLNNLVFIYYNAPLFTRSIGTAITHHCMEFEALEYEPETSFDLMDLLQLYGREAEVCIQLYVKRYIDSLPRNGYYEYLYYIYFICQLCAHAIMFERSDMVLIVILKAADALYFWCNHYMHYYRIARAAVEYNSYHRAMHEESEDEGCFSSFEDEEG